VRKTVIVQKMREKRKLTQEALSARSGVKQQTISAIESGKNKNPRIDTLYLLARALHCTVDDLIEEENTRGA
jgi:Predicted transcriptional regulators